MVAPAKIHTKLHWFYWESYSTWLSGFGLFTVLYLWNAGSFLIDKSLKDWSPVMAGTSAVGFLVAFWIVYDVICRVFGFKKNGELIVAGLMIVVVAFASWLANQLFAGRAAFLLVGAMIATAMSANVFFWIIPGQRKVVESMTSGEEYDIAVLSIHGKRGKQRSVHNTYFTLPVIFAMLSNHYSFLYTNEYRWIILFVMMFAGALIRQFFVQRHAYHLGRASNPWPFAAVGCVLILSLIYFMKPAPTVASAQEAAPATFAQIKPVLEQRCYMCHGEVTQMKGIRLDQTVAVKQNAQGIFQQVAVARQMPLNNATQITEDERALIKRWYEAGASVE
jgi:uncharacterized membrane protein